MATPHNSEIEFTPLQQEMVDFMVRLFRLMDLPKTVGSIYGYVYSSYRPVSMDQLTHSLGISLGSASQGLRTLKVFRAVRTVYTQGERREFFEAETDFQVFVGSFLKGELVQYIENTQKRTVKMHEYLSDCEDEKIRAFYAGRLSRLEEMNGRAKQILPLISEIFSSENGW